MKVFKNYCLRRLVKFHIKQKKRGGWLIFQIIYTFTQTNKKTKKENQKESKEK